MKNIKNILIGCGIAVAGVVLGAKSKKAQSVVNSVETAGANAVANLKNKFKKSEEQSAPAEEPTVKGGEEFDQVN